MKPHAIRILTAASASLALALAASPVRADDAPARRTPPIYDGRTEERPTSAGDVSRAVGRAVLFPLYAAVEYGGRKPTGFLVSTLEQSRTARRVFRYLFLGPPPTGPSFYPMAFYDFGFTSSVGLRMVWANNFLTPGSSIAVKLAAGDSDWRRADASLRVALPAGFAASTDLQMRRRPDHTFHGIGSRSSEDALARYTLSRASAAVGLGWRGLTAFAGVSTLSASDSEYSGDASIPMQVAAGRIAGEPAGYGELLVVERAGARLALDTRGEVRAQSGARLDATVERAREAEHGAWTRLEAIVGGALRLDPVHEYKLDLRLRVELVEPDAGVEVPFLELASIGGSRDLRGFASGRGRDASAVALTLDYQWPIAAWLDATAYVGAGNVFGPRLEGFYAGKLRGSFGGGLAFNGFGADRQIELWSAVGTDPFDEGLHVSSFRLVLGYSYDY